MLWIQALLFSLALWGRLTTPEALLRLQTYQVKLEHCRTEKRMVITLREFLLDGKKSRWIVDPQTLRTQILNVKALTDCRTLNIEKLMLEARLPREYRFEYFRSLKKYNQFPGQIQGQGLTQDERHKEGSYLTIDLCPSKSPVDRSFFEKVHQNQWPVGIAISGLWLLRHDEDWKWLRTLLANDDILWINHSRNHPVYPERPIEQNYLLSEGRDIQKEIIDNEKLLIQRGLTPSIFFRFPGLVANENALKITRHLGLITLGSNAWLGKGQKPKVGSIILLHGNGNDPKGLAFFDQYGREKKFSLPFKNLLSIFDISASR